MGLVEAGCVDYEFFFRLLLGEVVEENVRRKGVADYQVGTGGGYEFLEPPVVILHAFAARDD